MRVLEGLEPKRVFHYFEELCAIPHGSGNTKAISDYCAAFAREHGLKYRQDKANNILIWKAGSAGYESAAPVILQGHLDMVCEKTAECRLDMEKEGLELAVDGDLVLARGTTLGGDDGIAVAMVLAILEAQELPHPPLEAVFTDGEEVGMLGAMALDMSDLRGRKLLNIDSETEGIFTVSCAGGNVSCCRLPLCHAAFEGRALRVTLTGLRGGHSGAEIDKGRGNANVLAGRVLLEIGKKTALRVVSVTGGLKNNAIPVETVAQIVVADEIVARTVAAELELTLKKEYRVTDPAVRVLVETSDPVARPMDAATSAKLLCMLNCLPNGIQTMSADIHGLVQTSLNLGILSTEEDAVTATFCVRSSVGTQKEMVKERLQCLMEQLGGTAEFWGDYPGWEYQPDSALRDLMAEVFRAQYGREPKIEAIHAGVECGLFSDRLSGLDCVSVGPDLTEIHTPRERMSISSVARLWAFVLEVLRRSK